MPRICDLKKSLMTSVQKKQWNKICKSKQYKSKPRKSVRKPRKQVRMSPKKEKQSRICEIPVNLLTEKQKEMRAKKC
jgi:hypothetical protein